MAREKGKLLQLRVSDVQKAVVEANAKREGSTVTDFVLSRCLPAEVNTPCVADEIGDAIAETFEPSATKGNDLASVKERFGLKTGAQLFEGPANPEKSPAQRRAFNPNRSGWYDLIKQQDDWGQVLKDRTTGQVWLYANGRSKEFLTEQAAVAALENA